MPTFPRTKTAQLSQFELRSVWQRRMEAKKLKRESGGGGANGKERGRERQSNEQGKEGVKKK